jgi:hypothetical protein
MDIVWGRAICRDCGGRMKVASGAFVRWLQKSGDLYRMVMAG